jgi:hypothetical protein
LLGDSIINIVNFEGRRTGYVIPSLALSVADFKEFIKQNEGITEPFQIMFAGKHIDNDERTLYDFNVKYGSVIHLIRPENLERSLNIKLYKEYDWAIK